MKGDVVMSNDVKNSQMVGQPADHGFKREIGVFGGISIIGGIMIG